MKPLNWRNQLRKAVQWVLISFFHINMACQQLEDMNFKLNMMEEEKIVGRFDYIFYQCVSNSCTVCWMQYNWWSVCHRRCRPSWLLNVDFWAGNDWAKKYWTVKHFWNGGLKMRQLWMKVSWMWLMKWWSLSGSLYIYVLWQISLSSAKYVAKYICDTYFARIVWTCLYNSGLETFWFLSEHGFCDFIPA